MNTILAVVDARYIEAHSMVLEHGFCTISAKGVRERRFLSKTQRDENETMKKQLDQRKVLVKVR